MMVYSAYLLLALKLTLAAGACPQDFVELESSCYFFSHNQVEWVGARDICKEILGANLAEISSAEEDVAIMKVVKRNNLYYWVGANDILVEGDWRLASTNQPMTYTNWGVGEPNNYHQSEDCMALLPTLGWVDAACVGQFNYICELPLQ